MDEKLLSSYAGERSEKPLYLRWTPADVVACQAPRSVCHRHKRRRPDGLSAVAPALWF